MCDILIEILCYMHIARNIKPKTEIVSAKLCECLCVKMIVFDLKFDISVHAFTTWTFLCFTIWHYQYSVVPCSSSMLGPINAYLMNLLHSDWLMRFRAISFEGSIGFQWNLPGVLIRLLQSLCTTLSLCHRRRHVHFLAVLVIDNNNEMLDTFRICTVYRVNKHSHVCHIVQEEYYALKTICCIFSI